MSDFREISPKISLDFGFWANSAPNGEKKTAITFTFENVMYMAVYILMVKT